MCGNKLWPSGSWIDILGAKEAMTYTTCHHINELFIPT